LEPNKVNAINGCDFFLSQGTSLTVRQLNSETEDAVFFCRRNEFIFTC